MINVRVQVESEFPVSQVFCSCGISYVLYSKYLMAHLYKSLIDASFNSYKKGDLLYDIECTSC